MKSRIIALLALFSLLLALPVGTGLAQSEFEGAAVVYDDAASSDAIAYTMKNVPAPSSGTDLVGWLLSDDGAIKLSTGPMECPMAQSPIHSTAIHRATPARTWSAPIASL